MVGDKTGGLRPITWAAIIGGLFAAATIAVALVSIMRTFEHSCEACVTFRGRTQCRTAAARTVEEATKTAVDNACGVLGVRGMAESIECGKTLPDRVTCDGG